MNSDLRRFISHYATLLLAVLLSVSFFAFLVIPYSLGSHPGDERISQGPAPVTQAQAQAQPKV